MLIHKRVPDSLKLLHICPYFRQAVSQGKKLRLVEMPGLRQRQIPEPGDNGGILHEAFNRLLADTDPFPGLRGPGNAPDRLIFHDVRNGNGITTVP